MSDVATPVNGRHNDGRLARIYNNMTQPRTPLGKAAIKVVQVAMDL